MTSRIQDVWMIVLAYANALIGLVASVLLLLMFVFEVSFNGPYVFGSGYEWLAVAGGLVSAILVVKISARLAPDAMSRAFPAFVFIALIVGASAALLVAMQVFDPVVLILVQAAVIVVEAVWMFWVNRRLASDGAVSNWTGSFGRLIGLGLMIGLPLAGIGLTLPVLTIPQILLLGVGIFLAGGVWLVWPLWWILIGTQLGRGAVKASASRTSGKAKTTTRSVTTSATTRSAGHRKA